MILDPNLYVEVLIYSYIYQGFQSCDISEIFCYYIMCCGGGGGLRGRGRKGSGFSEDRKVDGSGGGIAGGRQGQAKWIG